MVMNPDEPTSPLGLRKWGVFVTLKASTRASRLIFLIGNLRKSERSRFPQPGPRIVLRPVLPKRTSVTGAHALVA